MAAEVPKAIIAAPDAHNLEALLDGQAEDLLK